MTDTVVSSATREVVIGFDRPFVIIGERINPTGRKILAAQLEAGDFSTVEADALAQVAAGATMLDVNAGVVYNSNPNPNETEPPLMRKMISLVQGLVDVPLCIDSSVPAALEAGIAFRRPLPGTVFHSDRGSVYAATAHRKILRQHGFVGSMGRRGNPYDNTKAESLIKTLKVEAVYVAGYETFEDAAADLPSFIEEVCNETRLHSALGYLSPARYEEINRPDLVKTAA